MEHETKKIEIKPSTADNCMDRNPTVEHVELKEEATNYDNLKQNKITGILHQKESIKEVVEEKQDTEEIKQSIAAVNGYIAVKSDENHEQNKSENSRQTIFATSETKTDAAMKQTSNSSHAGQSSSGSGILPQSEEKLQLRKSDNTVDLTNYFLKDFSLRATQQKDKSEKVKRAGQYMELAFNAIGNTNFYEAEHLLTIIYYLDPHENTKLWLSQVKEINQAEKVVPITERVTEDNEIQVKQVQNNKSFKDDSQSKSKSTNDIVTPQSNIQLNGNFNAKNYSDNPDSLNEFKKQEALKHIEKSQIAFASGNLEMAVHNFLVAQSLYPAMSAQELLLKIEDADTAKSKSVEVNATVTAKSKEEEGVQTTQSKSEEIEETKPSQIESKKIEDVKTADPKAIQMPSEEELQPVESVVANTEVKQPDQVDQYKKVVQRVERFGKNFKISKHKIKKMF